MSIVKRLGKTLPFGIVSLLVVLIVYMYCDMNVGYDSIVSNYNTVGLDTVTLTNHKANFKWEYEEFIQKQQEQETEEALVSINSNIFSPISVRLNMEAYSITDQLTNEKMRDLFWENQTSNLALSSKELFDPLMFLAITTCESQGQANTKYLWTPVVYTKSLSEEDINHLDIAVVDEDYYRRHLDTEKFNAIYNAGTLLNDSDSLGPMQILRSNCNKNDLPFDDYKVEDLLRWEDNVIWAFSELSSHFNDSCWNRDYTIQNKYELMVLYAIMHNTGAGFATTEKYDFSVNYKNSEAAFQYARDLTSEKAISYFTKLVDDYFTDGVLRKASDGDAFTYLGDKYCNGSKAIDNRNEALQAIGLDVSTYLQGNREDGPKLRYPMEALINYMILERLYMGGTFQ